MTTLDSVTLPTLLNDATPEMPTSSPDTSAEFDDGILDGTDDYEPLDSGTENEPHEVDGGDANLNRYAEKIAALEKKFGPNWDERIDGLQGSLQQAVEARRAAENARIEMENRIFEYEIRDLPEPEKRMAREQLEEAREAEAERAELSTTKQMLNEMARVFITDQISKRYGVPVAQLQRFNDPESMAAFAEIVASERQQRGAETRRKKRQSSGADRFEGGGNPAPAPKKQYNGDLRAAASDFAAAAAKAFR